MTSRTRFLLLHGSAEPPAEPATLRAGPVRALLDGADLRYLRIGGTELVRRVYAAVRDRDWNTVPGQLSGLELDVRDASFEVRFRLRHSGPGVDFSWDGSITGSEEGRIAYTFEGRAGRAMEYCRIGICVHHPWRETAGRPFRARTPEGEIEGAFPDLIGPQRFEGGVYHPLFQSFDRLEVELAGGGSVLLDLEGDLWETEDHRNWTDANFKTYSTPLALGFPHRLAAGEALVQKLTVVPRGIPSGAAEDGPVRLAVGAPTGATVPAIGLGADSDGHSPSAHEAALAAALAPAHLRVEVRLDRDGWAGTLEAAQEIARRLGCHLEVSLHLRPDAGERLSAVAKTLGAGPPVDRVLVILAGGRHSTPEETTPAALLDAVRSALSPELPGAAFVGGTEMYFTEINRTRPQADTWDGVCFSIMPQMHAFTDVDIVENLDAQAENVRSGLALSGGKPVIVSPITLGPRAGFYADDPEAVPEPAPGELPGEVDPRQPSLLGAAWTAGSLKYVSESGASAVTYYETTGWRGVLEREEGTPLPERFASRPGKPFPLYHPLRDVAGWRGAEVLACPSSDPLAAIGLAVRTAEGAIRLLVVNLTPRPLEVAVAPLDGGLVLRRLNEDSAARAADDPDAFRAAGEGVEAAGTLALQLAPYEVVRVDPA